MKCIKKQVSCNGTCTVARGKFSLISTLPLTFEMLKKLRRRFPHIKFVDTGRLFVIIEKTGVAKLNAGDSYDKEVGRQIAESKMYAKLEDAAEKLLYAWWGIASSAHADCLAKLYQFKAKRLVRDRNEA